MQVSFLIPLYNGLALTRTCLASLQETLPAGLDHEIIFIDDGSTDGTREWLATLADPCRVILHEENLGYAVANNRGARAARGEFLALLNSDLELLPGWLEPLLAALRRDPKLALVGNVQRRKDDHAVDHAGIEFGADAKLRHRRVLPAAASLRRRPVRRVAAVTAACCLVRRAAFLGARGGFDTGYRNGAEDVDLCLRLASQGHRVAVVLNSEVYHHVSASRGVTAEHNEANSRRLFTLWREELITLCARTWARETLARARREPGQVDGRTRLAALGTLLPGRKPTRRARYEITTAIFLEELHWNHAFSLPEPKPPTDHRLYHLDGLLPDDIERGTWSTRERFKVKLPAWVVRDSLFVFGTVLPPTPGRPETRGRLGLRVIINGVQHLRFFPLADRPFSCGTERVLLATDEPVELTVEILGTAKQNFLAWLGRRTAPLPLPRSWRAFLQAHRPQPKNRRIRIAQIAADGRAVYDFGLPQPLNLDRGHRSLRPPGLNVVGWFRAELGLGESARCMARACEAADVPAAFIDMKLPCLNRGGDDTFTTKLQTTNPYHVNVVHLDPPATPEFDRFHGEVFRRGRRNIAYWAWELAEFPDEWVPACAYFQEIWCPSAFVRDAIAAKVPLPVIVMPHAIGFEPPGGDQRPRFGLPADRFLFLFLYDLNSYQERKNPLAVIEAYRRAFPDEAGVALVIKTQNRARNPGEYARLEEAVRGLAHVTLIADTLSREDVHALEAACDCFVSLHRSEGFGLAVAECMHLGKPVIATDWSATAEFVSHDNGRPIPWREIEITETHGPYRKGQRWADPEVDAAAAAMRELAGDPALARRLGEAARRTIAERFAPAVIGRRYQARLDAMRLWLG